jgi:AraC-like DNA-binding protein
MEAIHVQMLRTYLNAAQLQLYVVHHGKVSPEWDYHIRQPEINRLYYFQEGAGTIHIRNREYSPQPGQLFLLPANVEITLSTDKANTFRKYFCHFTLTVGEVHLFQMFHVPHFIDVIDREWLDERFRKLIALSESQSLTTPLQIKSVLYDILTLFLDRAQLQGIEEDWRIDATTPATTRLNTVLSYIDEHLSDRMKIDELAKQLHFHPKYFIQLFKSSIGVSPIVYITKKRMEKAQQLLMFGQISITDIADQVGMDLYYFSHTFRKFIGLSPTEYRHYWNNHK